MWTRALSVAIIILVGCVSSASAQEVAAAPDSSMWRAAAIGIVLLLGVAVVSFLSSRRTHRD